MAKQQEGDDQIRFLLSDFNTRLRDFEERNRLMRERVILLGQNLIAIKEDLDKELKAIKKQNAEIQEDVAKISHSTKDIVEELNKFVKKEEILLVERMVKDFQPLDFARKKDVEEMIEEKISPKQIKTEETSE